ncbi:MAG: hypothetical protein ABI670_07980 [Chloroflexota bacterium]
MTENYQDIFDASQQGFPWTGLLWSLVGLSIISTGLYWVKYREKLPVLWREVGLLGAGASIIFGTCFTVVVTTSLLSAHSQAIDALQTGTASVTEGQVISVITMAGGKAQSFTVSGVRFTYSEYSESVGYHHTTTHGGVINEGIYVRIHYMYIEGDPSEPAILKLETKK